MLPLFASSSCVQLSSLLLHAPLPHNLTTPYLLAWTMLALVAPCSPELVTEAGLVTGLRHMFTEARQKTIACALRLFFSFFSYFFTVFPLLPTCLPAGGLVSSPFQPSLLPSIRLFCRESLGLETSVSCWPERKLFCFVCPSCTLTHGSFPWRHVTLPLFIWRPERLVNERERELYKDPRTLLSTM